ncbi:DUF1385 domain-containing protein [Chloroflexota bacterium]
MIREQKNATTTAELFNYGGQAVIEGVMIRGQRSVATTVRRPNGELTTDIRPLSGIYSGRIRQTPFLRGVIVLIEAMVLGIKSLLYSANVSLEEEVEKISPGMVWLMMAVSLGLAVVLFLVAPLLLTRLLDPYIDSPLIFNLIDGGIRVIIFIGYLKLMTLMPDLRRVFAYHGAEHKVINAYEHGVPLEVSAVKKHSTAHTRCGTSFLFVVMIVAIITFTLVGRPTLWLMILARIVLIPVISAVSYEVVRFGAKHTRNILVRIIMAPGLWLQSLTTREPDDSQLEVAIASLQKVLESEQAEETVQAPI